MFPEKIKLANLETPITKMERISIELNKNIYIKRDDLTGLELSGNKVRKLEYSLKEALDLKSDVIITCGAIQSNHARATVVAARMLGLKVHLVLRGQKPEHYSGNMLINRILDAETTYLTPESFIEHASIMEAIKRDYASKGLKAYIIPVGASNGIGNFGYYNAYAEILKQEDEMNISFDAIVSTVGSGGTYSGLYFANHFNDYKKKIIGYSVGGSKEYFVNQVNKILAESLKIIDSDFENPIKSSISDHLIFDEFQGEGYALTSHEDISFIKYVAKLEGIIFDPVYTGKAFKGLYTHLKQGEFSDCNNILFIHTGGFFGLEAFENWF